MVVAQNRVEDAYRSIHAQLWRSLYAYTGDQELASDAEAEAFAQALRRGDELDDVSAWVWTSAFRIAKGMIAKRVPTTSEDWDRPFEDEQLLEFIDQLDGLSEQQRSVVVLRYLGGFNSREIANLLHTSAGSVRVQLHRAHQTLRSLLTEETQ